MLVIFYIINIFLSVNVVANSNVEKIIIEPESPTPLSKVNFTVIMKNDTECEDIRLILQECAEDLCFFPGLNQSMLFTDNNTYYDQVTLRIDKATQIKYSINFMVNGSWNSTKTYFINLSNLIDSNQTDDGYRSGVRPYPWSSLS